MSIVFSSWDNRDGGEDFELEKGQSKANTCSNAYNLIENFTVNKYGSIEDPKDDTDPNPNPDPNPDPNPEPEPTPGAVVEQFWAYTDYYSANGEDWPMYVAGLEDMKLEAEGDAVTLG